VSNIDLVMIYCFTQLVGIKFRRSLVENGRPNNQDNFVSEIKNFLKYNLGVSSNWRIVLECGITYLNVPTRYSLPDHSIKFQETCSSR
jgi:hypothetical protein